MNGAAETKFLASARSSFRAEQGYAESANNCRIVVIETNSAIPFTEFAFRANDVLMLGRETLGTPAAVMAACDAIVIIPMAPGNRSFNVTISGAIVLTEALRQTGGWEQAPSHPQV